MHTASKLSVLTLVFAAGSASAQYDWNIMASSTWNDGSAWAGPVSPAFPNSDTADANIMTGGIYTVSVSNGNWAVNNVTKTNPSATLQLNRTLQLYGDFVNEGATVIAAPSTGNANLRFRGAGARSITGIGTITLASNATNDQSATIDRSAFDTTEITFGPTQSISGTGRLSVPFVNQGTISATGGGTITINTANDLAINNGTIEANTGGTLRLVDVTLDCQNISTINIDDGTLEFNGQTFAQRLANTEVFTFNGGIMRAIQGNCELQDVTLNGDADGATRVGYRFFGSSFENNGTMTLTGDGVNGFTALQVFSTPYSFTGTGEIVLLHPAMTNPGAAPSIDDNSGDEVLTNGVNHTIRGKFRNVIDTINLGTITADQTDESVDLIIEPVSNQGILRATNGGILRINNDTTQSGAGFIDLDGGFLDALPIGGGLASITGNSIIGTNGGKVRLMDGNLAIQDVTLDTDSDILGQQLRSRGGNTNNGSMLLQLDGGNFGILSFEGPQTWSGTGEIVLNADSDLLLQYAQVTRTTADDPVVHANTHTIRGTGQIRAALDNRGLVSADVPGRTLLLLTDNKLNSGTMRADSGILSISAITIDQTDSGNGAGLLEATNGGVITLGGNGGSTIIGGDVDVSGGVMQVATAFNRVEDISLLGTFEVDNSSNIVAGTINNNGLIWLNTTNAGLRTLSFDSAVTLEGSGMFRLGGFNNINSAVVLPLSGTATLEQSATHTIEGDGGFSAMTITNHGTLNPGLNSSAGEEIGTIQFGNGCDTTCTPTSVINLQIAGTNTGEFDRIDDSGSGQSTFHCAGTLNLSNFGGFSGLTFGDSLEIISAPGGRTGTFDAINYFGEINYEISYQPDGVLLIFDCTADTNNDGVLDPSDFTAWINAFNNSLPECDQNNDGACTATDFTAWIANFNAGC